MQGEEGRDLLPLQRQGAIKSRKWELEDYNLEGPFGDGEERTPRGKRSDKKGS
jgi:hypothetical protein